MAALPNNNFQVYMEDTVPTVRPTYQTTNNTNNKSTKLKRQPRCLKNKTEQMTSNNTPTKPAVIPGNE